MVCRDTRRGLRVDVLPGARVAALLIGPSVKRGSIDSTTYDTASILKFITQHFELEPLPGIRTNMGNLSNALQ